MHVTGSGSRHSPIAFLDDSDDENIPAIGNPDHSSTPDDLLLSPRPGTFLSVISRPHHSAIPAKKVKNEGSQQSHNRKRKRPTTPLQNSPTIGAGRGETDNSTHSVTGVNQSQQESKKQRKLRLKLEREKIAAQQEQLQAKVNVKSKQKTPTGNISSTAPSKGVQNQSAKKTTADENAPPTKRAKQDKVLNAPLPSVERASTTPVPVTSPSPLESTLESRESHTQRQPLPSSHDTSRPPQAHNQHPPPSWYGDHTTSLPPRPPAPIPFDQYIGSSSMLPDFLQPQPSYGMEFDPLLPWLYMPMGPFSAMNMQTMSTPAPSTNQSLSQPNPPPLQKVPQKAPSGANKKASKTKTTRQLQPTVPLPNPEKAFTIRILERTTGDSFPRSYVPIGKPDFHFKHGVFPIIPSIMLPDIAKSSSTSTSVVHFNRASYEPNIKTTLVLENIPNYMCNMSWVESWCISASGVKPKHVLLCPRRALVEFREQGEAIDVWVSLKLGVDEVGHRLPEDVGGGAQSIIAFWYRPDLEQEKGLLELWKHSKKILAELVSVATVKDEETVIKAIDEALVTIRERMEPKEREEGELDEDSEREDDATVVELMGNEMVALSWKLPSSGDVKGDFRKFAEKLGFWKKLMDAVAAGMDDDYVPIYEQQEIARIDRIRSIIHSKAKKQQSVSGDRKRKLDDYDEESTRVEAERKKKKVGRADSEDTSIAQPNASAPGASTTVSTSLIPSTSQSSAYPSTCSAAVPPSTAITKPPIPHPSGSGTVSDSTLMKPILPSKPNFLSAPSLPPKPPASRTKASSILKPPRGFGSSLTMPATSQNNTSSTAATAPIHINQASSKRVQVSSISDSVSSSSAQGTAIVRSSASLSTVGKRNDADKKSTQAPFMAHNNIGDRSAPSLLRPSELLVAVKKKEKNPVPGDKETLQSLQPVPVKSVDTPGDIKTGSGVNGDFGNGSEVPSLSAVATPVSPWKLGVGKLAEALRTAGRGLLRRDSSTSLSLTSAPPNLSLTTEESVLKPASASSLLTVAEPSAPPVSTPQEQTEKNGDRADPVGPIVPDDIVISKVSEKVECFKPQCPPDTSSGSLSLRIPQQVTSNVLKSTTSLVPTNIPAPVTPQLLSPVKDLNRTLKISTELMKILVQPTDQRQKFLDGEFKATKVLLDRLVNATSRVEKKKITDLWKERIRIIDEVTTSLKNDSRAWYSALAMGWVRLRWPKTPDGAGILVLSDDDEDLLKQS